MDKPRKQVISIGSLRAHLSAFRSQRSGNPKDAISLLALKLQEIMVRGAIQSCRLNGVSENDILLLLGEDISLAVAIEA